MLTDCNQEEEHAKWNEQKEIKSFSKRWHRQVRKDNKLLCLFYIKEQRWREWLDAKTSLSSLTTLAHVQHENAMALKHCPWNQRQANVLSCNIQGSPSLFTQIYDIFGNKTAPGTHPCKKINALLSVINTLPITPPVTSYILMVSIKHVTTKTK